MSISWVVVFAGTLGVLLGCPYCIPFPGGTMQNYGVVAPAKAARSKRPNTWSNIIVYDDLVNNPLNRSIA